MIKLNRKVCFLIILTVLAVNFVYGEDDDGIIVEEVKKDKEQDLKVIKEDLTKRDREARQINAQSVMNTLYMMGLVAGMFLTTYYFEPPSHQFNLDQFPAAARDENYNRNDTKNSAIHKIGDAVLHAVDYMQFTFGKSYKPKDTSWRFQAWHRIADSLMKIVDLLELDHLRTLDFLDHQNGIYTKLNQKTRQVREVKNPGPYSLLVTRILRLFDMVGLDNIAPTNIHDAHNGMDQQENPKSRTVRDTHKKRPFSLLANRLLRIFDLVGLDGIKATKNHDDHNSLGPKPRDKREATVDSKKKAGFTSSIILWADRLMSILDGIRTTRLYDDNNSVDQQRKVHHRDTRRVPVNDPQTVQGPDVPSRAMSWSEAIGMLIKSLGETLLGKLNYSVCEKFDMFSEEFKDCLLSLKKSG